MRSILTNHIKSNEVDAEQSLTEEGCVIVQASSSMLVRLYNSGEGKTSIYPEVIKSMSDNKPCAASGSQIGDGPYKPIVLARGK